MAPGPRLSTVRTRIPIPVTMSTPSPAGSGPDRRQRNRQALAAYAACNDPDRRRHWRNIVVTDNLPLVYSIAGRVGARAGMGLDDLAQVGCLGLIRAVESFDASRCASLSSFAVPFVRGAMLHALRDRQAMMRIPRDLWERRQRLSSCLERRRRLGLPAASDAELASLLGCSQAELREARALSRQSEMRSLDAPLGSGEDGGAATLLDQLPDPAATDPRPEADRPSTATPELLWLRQRLQQLDPALRQLLDGRLRLGCSWVELGRQLGITARQAQRRHDAALAQLQAAAATWRQDAAGPAEGRPAASVMPAPTAPAAPPGPVPAASPAEPPAGSACR